MSVPTPVALALPAPASGSLSPLVPEDLPYLRTCMGTSLIIGLLEHHGWPRNADPLTQKTVVQCWGVLYHVEGPPIPSEVDEDLREGQGHQFWTWLGNQDYRYRADDWLMARHPELEPLLSLDLVERRSYYIYGLHRLLARQDLSPQQRATLAMERTLWMEHDRGAIARRIESRCSGDFSDPKQHWLWQGPLGLDRPHITWGGVQGVPIHRVLWPHFRPYERLTLHRRPRKIERCPDDGPGRRCVNPFHFEEAVKMRPGTNGRTRHFVGDDLVPGYRPLWYAANAVQASNGNWFIPCPVNPEHGPLGGKAQHDYQQGIARGRGYCTHCYRWWRKTVPTVSVKPYARRIEPLVSRAQLEERARSQMETNQRARRDEQRVQDALRAIEEAFGQDPAEGI